MKLTVAGNTKADVAVTGANGTIAANAVTANGDFGRLTTPALSTAADAWEAAITFTNSNIKATSSIFLTVNTVGGAVGTNGVPHAIIDGQTDGSCTLYVGNIGTAALSGAAVISYLVIND